MPAETQPPQPGPRPEATAPPGSGRGTAVPPTRTGRTWFGLAITIVLLIVVLVLILQNLHSVRVGFFWAHWKIPLGVDLLLAAVVGALIVFTAGSLRILQLRRQARRNARRQAAPPTR